MGANAAKTTSDMRCRRKPPGLRPVRRQPELVGQVVDQIREAIFSGQFSPGSTLPSERLLGETLGVSYTVVREATRVLRSQGLLEMSQGRRARVKPAGPEVLRASLETMMRRTTTSLRELTDLRRLLECEIADLAAALATPQHVEAMQAAIDDLKTAFTLDQQIAADMRFHQWLARASGNALFAQVLSAVTELQWESRRQAFVNVGIGHAVEGHEAVLQAVRRRDRDAARRTMLEHMRMIVLDLNLEGNRQESTVVAPEASGGPPSNSTQANEECIP